MAQGAAEEQHDFAAVVDANALVGDLLGRGAADFIELW